MEYSVENFQQVRVRAPAKASIPKNKNENSVGRHF